MSDDLSMYDTEDLEQPVKSNTTDVVVKNNQFVSEIKIGDSVVSVVNPDYINYLNQRIADLSSKCVMLENEIRLVKQDANRKEALFNRAINQINSKFGFGA